MQWSLLTTLNLCISISLLIASNSIRDNGAQYLSMSKWPHLVTLDLCILVAYL